MYETLSFKRDRCLEFFSSQSSWALVVDSTYCSLDTLFLDGPRYRLNYNDAIISVVQFFRSSVAQLVDLACNIVRLMLPCSFGWALPSLKLR